MEISGRMMEMKIAWLFAPPLAQNSGSSQWISILFIVALIVLFYFMLIRPQQRRMRQQMELMKSLRVGDDVMTSAGIYGTISEVEEDTVLLEVAEDVDIRVAKSAIVKIFTPREAEEEEEKDTAEGQSSESTQAEEENSGESRE